MSIFFSTRREESSADLDLAPSILDMRILGEYPFGVWLPIGPMIEDLDMPSSEGGGGRSEAACRGVEVASGIEFLEILTGDSDNESENEEILELLAGDSDNVPNKLLHDRRDVDKNSEDEKFGRPQVQHIQDIYELLSPWYTSAGMSIHRA